MLNSIKLISQFSNGSIVGVIRRGRRTDLDEQILRFLLERGPSSLGEIRSHFRLSKSTCESALIRLERSGFLKRIRVGRITKWNLTSKEATCAFLNEIDKVRQILEADEGMPIMKMREYESFLSNLSRIKFVTPLHYESFDLEDWLEFLDAPGEVDKSHPFFQSLEDFIERIKKSRMFENLVMIKIVRLLKDLTALYYKYWSVVVKSSSLNELNENLLRILNEESKKLNLYQELKKGGLSYKKPLANEVVRELSKFMLEILREQVARKDIITKLKNSDVVNKIDEILGSLT